MTTLPSGWLGSARWRVGQWWARFPRRLQGRWSRAHWPAQLAEIRRQAAALQDLSPAGLLEVSLNLREALHRQPEELRWTEGCALAAEALRRTLGITLHDVQLQAAAAMLAGQVVEMHTGEGKTYACFPVALVHALAGRGVHVATPNPYLAERDCRLLQPCFGVVGLTAGLLPERCEPSLKRQAYLCDATYGTAYEFGFDYLRDQVALRSSASRPLGERLSRLAEGELGTEPATAQRGLAAVIIDEIDHVLLDDATSPLVLSVASPDEAPDAAVHLAARQLLPQLTAAVHFITDSWTQRVELTPAGLERIHATDVAVPLDLLLRTWSEYVEQALHAEHSMRRDIHYVVDQGQVRIVDQSTGRIFQDRSWKDGLHQAVEAKEGLRITAEKQSLAQITRQRFFRLYERVCGATGTARGCDAEFRSVYQLGIQAIPLRIPSLRQDWPMRAFATAAAKFAAIVDSTAKLQASGRPVLIGTSSIADSEHLRDLCLAAGISCQVLNGRQDAVEAEVISRAGQSRTVTIATHLAGRGTDIRLGPGVAGCGGLHVIVADCHASERTTRQLIGRCARQGDPGSTQVFVSAEDPVILRYGAWLAVFLRRNAGPDGELPRDLSGPVLRIQRAADRAGSAARRALQQRDQSRDALLTGTSTGS